MAGTSRGDFRLFARREPANQLLRLDQRGVCPDFVEILRALMRCDAVLAVAFVSSDIHLSVRFFYRSPRDRQCRADGSHIIPDKTRKAQDTAIRHSFGPHGSRRALLEFHAQLLSNGLCHYRTPQKNARRAQTRSGRFRAYAPRRRAFRAAETSRYCARRKSCAGTSSTPPRLLLRTCCSAMPLVPRGEACAPASFPAHGFPCLLRERRQVHLL